MVDEVHAHMKEILEVGAICPSQSPWCNAIVYLVLQIQEAIESLVGAGYFCLDLKAGFLQIAMDEASK